MVQTRREERREATIEEIKNLAWQQMAENGAAALSLRAIAREMRVSSAALYRYFANREALLTALSMDAYRSLNAALRKAAEVFPREDYAARLAALGNAYRCWVLAHPVQFALVYGAVVPGYQPPWDLLEPVAAQGLELLLTVLDAASRDDRLFSSETVVSESLRLQCERVIAARGYSVAVPVLYLALRGWSRLHGLVVLEAIGQLSLLEAPQAFFEAELQELIANVIKKD